jgi:hypothetical protein
MLSFFYDARFHLNDVEWADLGEVTSSNQWPSKLTHQKMICGEASEIAALHFFYLRSYHGKSFIHRCVRTATQLPKDAWQQ